MKLGGIYLLAGIIFPFLIQNVSRKNSKPEKTEVIHAKVLEERYRDVKFFPVYVSPEYSIIVNSGGKRKTIYFDDTFYGVNSTKLNDKIIVGDSLEIKIGKRRNWKFGMDAKVIK